MENMEYWAFSMGEKMQSTHPKQSGPRFLLQKYNRLSTSRKQNLAEFLELLNYGNVFKN